MVIPSEARNPTPQCRPERSEGSHHGDSLGFTLRMTF